MEGLYKLLLSVLCFFVGFNILKYDLSLKAYPMAKKLSTLLSQGLLLIFLFICYKTISVSFTKSLLCIIGSTLVSIVLIYSISKSALNKKAIVISYYILTNMICFYFIQVFFDSIYGFLFSSIYGLSIRNSPFGAPFKTIFVFPRYFKFIRKINNNNYTQTKDSSLYNSYMRDKKKSIIADFSFAGYGYGDISIAQLISGLCEFRVADFGIFPDSGIDMTDKIQDLIETVGKNGGGVLYFPDGEYRIGAKGKFIQINYSNVVIRGNSKKTTFVACCPTLKSEKNPWLSPFAFSVGENLQKSNIFWGVQFKRKKNIITRSNSLTDPGSDGTILEPPFLTRVLQEAFKGDDILFLEDTSALEGFKFILLVQFNIGDDDLIKDLLQVSNLKEEWGTANRAKIEEAPSFQWLVEIDHIVNANKVKLKQPLRRDILLKESPEIFGVEMLENIGLSNFTIRSEWNGLFRHHGFPIYFSKKESQIMDYGWNAINIKRASHTFVSDVHIENFSNPLYVLDSRNVTIRDIVISGFSGHQGIKLYGHSCDNLVQKITFLTDFADMMGGEGNCYGNVFAEIQYNNVENIYVDFDFHGFSEGPFSPPAYNLFENIYGFRGIKGGGALYNQPACAAFNIWWNIYSEGYDGSKDIFVNMAYLQKGSLGILLSSLRHGIVVVLQKKSFDVNVFVQAYKDNVYHLKKVTAQRKDHYKFFSKSIISGFNGYGDLRVDNNDGEIIVENFNENTYSSPLSLYNAQKQLKKTNHKV